MPPGDGRKHPHQEFLKIDTTNILFIAAGAFAGIEDIVRQRERKKSRAQTLGFSGILAGEKKDVFASQVRPEDLHKFGLIPEFIGRLPVIKAGVGGAVAVLGPAGQVRAHHRGARAGAFDGGGVGQPDGVIGYGHASAQGRGDPGHGGGELADALVVVRLAGHPGEYRSQGAIGPNTARDAQGTADCDAFRCPGYPGEVLGPAGRRRNEPFGRLPRWSRAAAHLARGYRLRLL